MPTRPAPNWNFKRVLNGMQIRDARLEDAEAICGVLRRSILELCRMDHGDDPAAMEAWLRNKTPENVASWIRRPGGSVLAACENETVAAVGGVTDEGDILLNYVSPDFRFCGFSSALIVAMERRAAERGARRCLLISTKTARRFYVSRGYQDVEGACATNVDRPAGLSLVKALPTPTEAAKSCVFPNICL